MTGKTFRLACLAAPLALGVAVAMPAAAQSGQDQRDRFEVFGPGERGWFEGRPEMFGQGQRGWFEERDRQVFDEGYRRGRVDERRAADRQMYGAARGEEAWMAMRYLRVAREELRDGNLREAWVALGRAETRLATRALPPGQPLGSAQEAATGAAVGAIRNAREAIRSRDVDLALERTQRAIALAERGAIIGRNVPGSALSGAGEPGPGQPLVDWTGRNQ